MEFRKKNIDKISETRVSDENAEGQRIKEMDERKMVE